MYDSGAYWWEQLNNLKTEEPYILNLYFFRTVLGLCQNSQEGRKNSHMLIAPIPCVPYY